MPRTDAETSPSIASWPTAVVMQPTSLCNLDCAYCYLPARRKDHRMALAVARAVADSLAGWRCGTRPLDVIWHGGEPLAAGSEYLDSLMGAFDDVPVAHHVQTNATLIDESWCALFDRRAVRVGVSVDGPGQDDALRLDLAGRPAHGRIMRGIDRLRRSGIPFTAIAVVSDPNPARAEALYDFFATLGCTSLGINIEEQEGVNDRPGQRDQRRVERFWAALLQAWQANPVLRVREIDRLLAYLAAALDGYTDVWLPAIRDPFPTVSWNGEVTLLSPELAGFSSSRYGRFACGNVLTRPLPDLIRDGLRQRWVEEFLHGVSSCQTSCAYYRFCGGGEPSNRHFELGRMDTTETDYCRNSMISLMEGALGFVCHT